MDNLNIANQDGFKRGETAYIIGQEHGTLCVSYGNNECEALGHAVDAGFLEGELMHIVDTEQRQWIQKRMDGVRSSPEYLWIKPASERKQVIK